MGRFRIESVYKENIIIEVKGITYLVKENNYQAD